MDINNINTLTAIGASIITIGTAVVVTFKYFLKDKPESEEKVKSAEHQILQSNEQGIQINPTGNSNITINGDVVNHHITNIPYQIPNPLATPIIRIPLVSPKKIREVMDDAPPLQKNQIAKNYEGIHIEWDTMLSNAMMQDENTVQLILQDSESNYNYITCKVKLSDYKELSILPKDTPIHVKGKIKKIDNLYIDLEEAHLFFPTQLA